MEIRGERRGNREWEWRMENGNEKTQLKNVANGQ